VFDLRDIVFAHIGSAADWKGFTIDCSKTFAQVIINFARHTVETYGPMAILKLVEDSTS
jgi:hypothetical protein